MAAPQSTAQPRLAAGCRWAAEEGEDRTLLFPEGAIRLGGTGRAILERCDGEHTVQQIVQELQVRYNVGDPARIAADVGNFLQDLHQKRIVDF
jgi:pyrroloquinoline quinone biosynthesis protein D